MQRRKNKTKLLNTEITGGARSGANISSLFESAASTNKSLHFIFFNCEKKKSLKLNSNSNFDSTKTKTKTKTNSNFNFNF